MGPEPEAIGTLQREHEFIEDRSNRLFELGEGIQSGAPVSSGAARIGVGLLDSCLHRVHAHQFDWELWPDAKAVPPPECTISLDRVRANHAQPRQSARALLGVVDRWSAGDPGARELVAEPWTGLAGADRAEPGLEEKHPLACLTSVTSAFPAPVPRELRGELDDRAGTGRAPEASTARYLPSAGTGAWDGPRTARSRWDRGPHLRRGPPIPRGLRFFGPADWGTPRPAGPSDEGPRASCRSEAGRGSRSVAG